MNKTYEECLMILEDKNKLNYSEMSIKWEEFKKKYPTLYEMLISSEIIDLKMLKFLCDAAIKQEKLSVEDKLENDFEIGDKLAKQFIYDKFPEPSEQQKEVIKESLRKKLNI